MRAGAPYDWPTFWDDYDTGAWEPETKAVLERFLSPDSLFVDIGAWAGPVTLWAVDLGARVVAYEPDPVAYEALLTNTKGLPVRAYRAAVTDQVGWAYLTNPHMGDSQSRLAEDGIIVATLTPRVVRAQCQQTPALVKIDVEGSELEILPDILAWRVPTYISWHQDWWAHPVHDDIRASWFADYTLEIIRGDGWTGFSEVLAVPK